MIAEWQRVTHRLLRALDAELADLRLSAGEVNALAALAEGPRTAAFCSSALRLRTTTKRVPAPVLMRSMWRPLTSSRMTSGFAGGFPFASHGVSGTSAGSA